MTSVPVQSTETNALSTAVRELTNALQAMSVPQDIEKYSGKDTTDVNKWFRDYEVMSMSKHWGDEEHLSWFPNFLTRKARIWLYGLPEEMKVAWPVLRAAFLQSFAKCRAFAEPLPSGPENRLCAPHNSELARP